MQCLTVFVIHDVAMSAETGGLRPLFHLGDGYLNELFKMKRSPALMLKRSLPNQKGWSRSHITVWHDRATIWTYFVMPFLGYSLEGIVGLENRQLLFLLFLRAGVDTIGNILAGSVALVPCVGQRYLGICS